MSDMFNKVNKPVHKIMNKNGPKLRIAIISRSNEDGGGASRMAAALARMLNQCENVTAHHWLGYPGQKWEPHMRPLYNGIEFKFFQKVCRLFSQIIGLPDFLTPEIFHFWNRKKTKYHIYHFHDISRTFSPIAFRWVARKKPTIWTFRDCSPFTGGCLYPMECKAFHKRCKKCFQLGKWPLMTFIDATGIMQDYKRTTAGMNVFTPIVASKWTADQAMKSKMFATRPQVIPNFVDLDIFRPMDKRKLRIELGLPIDDFIILMSAPKLDDKRKGAHYAVSVLQQLKPKVTVIITGKNRNQLLEKQVGNTKIYYVGYINNHAILAKYYAVSDIFLFTSMAETFCNAILESMACGTPPVAFASGAIPELVTHRIHGWLATPKKTSELIEGILFTINNPKSLLLFGKNARAKAMCYDQGTFLESHLSLYRQILRNHKTKGLTR